MHRAIPYAICTIDIEEDLWLDISKNMNESSRKRETPMGSETMQKCLLLMSATEKQCGTRQVPSKIVIINVVG